MNTTNAQIQADLAFCLESPEEFLGYDGRVATTKIIRTVAALNAGVTRKEFADTLVALGYNRNTVLIQFNQSRRVSLECGDCTLAADGSLVEVA